MHVKNHLWLSKADSYCLHPTFIYISQPLSSLIQSEVTKEAALLTLRADFEAQLESSQSLAEAKVSELKQKLMQVTENAEQTERELDNRIASMMEELDIKVGIGRYACKNREGATPLANIPSDTLEQNIPLLRTFTS